MPDQFTSDMSLALLNAAVKSFAKCADLSDYVERLFRMHYHDGEKKPACFVRIDKNHLINNIAKADALHNVKKRTRQFYIYSICLLIKCRSMEEAEDLILSILIVCYSEYEGK